MSFQIEKGVPIPTIKRPRGKGYKYPFEEMEVGDSFAFADKFTKSAYSRATKSAYYARVKSGKTKKYCVRVTDTGIRIWRKQ